MKCQGHGASSMASHATQTCPLIAGVSAIAGHDRRTPPTHGEEEVPDEGPGHVVVGVHDGLEELLLCHHGNRALVDHALNLVPQVLDVVKIRT